MFITSARIPAFFPVLRRNFTSSLFATERNPKIVPRTDLEFRKLFETRENKEYLIHLSHQWEVRAYERGNLSIDKRMKVIFGALARSLYIFNDAVRSEDIGVSGREVYLCRNTSTKKIESVAFIREFNGFTDMDPYAICINPDHIPHSCQSLNESALEGSDSYLVRMLVKFSSSFDYTFIRFPTLNQTQGYKNIIFQSKNADDTLFHSIPSLDMEELSMDSKTLDFMIHGRNATPDEFPKLFIKSLDE